MLSGVMVPPLAYGVDGRCMIVFRIVILVVASWFGVAMVWCTIVLPWWCLSLHVVMMRMSNLVMVLPNSSWLHRGCACGMNSSGGEVVVMVVW